MLKKKSIENTIVPASQSPDFLTLHPNSHISKPQSDEELHVFYTTEASLVLHEFPSFSVSFPLLLSLSLFFAKRRRSEFLKKRCSQWHRCRRGLTRSVTCFSTHYTGCDLSPNIVSLIKASSSKVFDGTFEIAWNDQDREVRTWYFRVDLLLVIFTYRRPPICVSCALIT